MSKSKKKTARKKTKKKKSLKANPGIRIKIRESVADEDNAHLKRRKSKHAPDSVYWRSADVEYTVTFTRAWPFQRPPDIEPRTIKVPAKGDSKTFTVDDDAPNGQYAYNISPPPASKPGQPLPGPDVSVDP